MTTLDELFDAPQHRAEIAGRTFLFSELPLAALARLQAFIKTLVPHPIDRVRGHLEGLADDERSRLLEEARDEARDWPPKIGTPAGAVALLSSEFGQVEAFYEGLLIHQPDTTRDQAAKIYRRLKRDVAKSAKTGESEDAEQPVRRIFGAIFGTYSEDEVEDEAPKS